MRIFHAAAVTTLLLFSAAVATGQDAVTRFRGLEEAWTRAIKARDRAQLESFLRPEYSLTVAVKGELVQVDRATWLKNALTTRVLHEFQFHEIIVREYGETAVVSSRYTSRATVDGRDRTVEYFLTDVWVRTAGKWQVSARYSSRPEPAPTPSPKPR